MQSAGSGSIVDRMIGVAKLDVPTFESIERDEGATGQALLVVVLAAIATGIGALGGDDAGRGLIAGVIGAILGWIAFSIVAYFVGATLFATAQTSVTMGQVLRVVGFAQTPRILGILGFIPLVGWLIALVAGIWFVVTAIVGLRQAFDFTTGRAVGTAVVALIVQVVILIILALIFNIGAAIFGTAV